MNNREKESSRNNDSPWNGDIIQDVEIDGGGFYIFEDLHRGPGKYFTLSEKSPGSVLGFSNSISPEFSWDDNSDKPLINIKSGALRLIFDLQNVVHKISCKVLLDNTGVLAIEYPEGSTIDLSSARIYLGNDSALSLDSGEIKVWGLHFSEPYDPLKVADIHVADNAILRLSAENLAFSGSITLSNNVYEDPEDESFLYGEEYISMVNSSIQLNADSRLRISTKNINLINCNVELLDNSFLRLNFEETDNENYFTPATFSVNNSSKLTLATSDGGAIDYRIFNDGIMLFNLNSQSYLGATIIFKNGNAFIKSVLMNSKSILIDNVPVAYGDPRLYFSMTGKDLVLKLNL